MKKYKFIISLLFSGIFACLAATSVTARLSSQQAYPNESIVLQIQVSTTEEKPNIAPIELPKMPDFTVRAQQRQESSSFHTSFINGKTENRSEYTFSYPFQLTPTKVGTLTIPPILVKVNGRTYNTESLTIQCSNEEQAPNIFLECIPSTTECFVGEAVTLTWLWGLDRQVYSFGFDIPLFSLDDFKFPNFRPNITSQNRDNYLNVPNFQQQEIIGEQKKITRNGMRLLAVEFTKPIIPTAPGIYDFPPSSVTFEIEDDRPTQRSRRQNNSPFDDFFDTRRPTRKLTINSKPFTLTVNPLPADGQPANFSGIIGQCQVSVTASPSEVSVGDPIILNITVSGPQYLDNIRLPDFAAQENFSHNFKISGDDPGIINGSSKTFQRTIRATNDKVTAVPPLEIPYFNSQTGKYSTAQSAEISLKVLPSRAITASDAQGTKLHFDDDERPGSTSKIQQAERSFTNNFPVEQLLERQCLASEWFRSPLVLLLLCLPPGIFAILLCAHLIARATGKNSAAKIAKNARPHCLEKLKQIKPESQEVGDLILLCLQEYFAQRFQLQQAAALTFQDVLQAASKHGIASEKLQAFQPIFAECEASKFAGIVTNPQKLKDEALTAVANWEK